MGLKIALAGNPNSGKTTLFNALTGSNQFVGNWPGVTVEKKEGKLKNHDDVIITDLPGIYSLSPYTLEEVVARNYLVNEQPDAILNIVDGTNIERNLYLTTQLIELGIPVVVAINMMDVVNKNGDTIDVLKLEKSLKCKIVEISALKESGLENAVAVAIEQAKLKQPVPMHNFSGEVEHAIAHIEEAVLHDLPDEKQRWYAIKLFERDDMVLKSLNLSSEILSHIEADIIYAENALDDDSESIIANERYVYIENILKSCYVKKNKGKLSVSDKIDRIVTNRYLALPIFALVMFLVYFISVTTVGTWVTHWTNDGLFGDGWHLLGIGSGEYEENLTTYASENLWTDDYKLVIQNAVDAKVIGAQDMLDAIDAEDFGTFDEIFGFYSESLTEKGYDVITLYDSVMKNAPAPEDFGIWVTGIPVLVGNGLESVNCAEWLSSLILNGIVGGVGAVLGFVPQILVLFAILAFLEACGYMARIAFVLDKLFRKFGLSGKSFIPILIGTGCGVPGIMASRTIENERDRRMTIITTTFIPCGAKLPVIALIASALFGGAWWVAPSAYFIGIAAIIISGFILKKTKPFQGDPAPFVMELPAYHMPTISNVLRATWERGWSFIKKAGTVILLASIIIWAGSVIGFVDGKFAFDLEMALENSILGIIGNAFRWIFEPLGFGNIKATVATFMGLIAKEEIVGVFGVLDFEGMTKLAGYSFLVFNLLCAPCFAAMGAIRREMNNWKWTAFAIAYQCVFAYSISLIIYQFGLAFSGNINVVGLIVAILVFGFMIYMLVRPYKKSTRFTKKV